MEVEAISAVYIILQTNQHFPVAKDGVISIILPREQATLSVQAVTHSTCRQIRAFLLSSSQNQSYLLINQSTRTIICTLEIPLLEKITIQEDQSASLEVAEIPLLIKA